MNTLEILYQAFKVRYSLNQLQQVLDRGCRVALIGAPSARDAILGYFGEQVPGLEGEGREDDLILLDPNLSEAEVRELKTCDACLVLFEGEPPEPDELEEIASKVPLHVKSLWLLLDPVPGVAGALFEEELTLPTLRTLPEGKEEKRFLRLFQAALPQISLIMARNYAGLRTEFCKTLTRRTAVRNGVRSGLASLPLKSIPVIGPALSFLAISAETLMLTASQLRLSFVIAAVHGRPLDFFDRINELWPIIGSAFGFRAVSRHLVKMLPKVGAGAKATVAFSGTYAVGEASRLYYELGRPTSDEVRRELLRLSHEEGAREAQRLFRRVMAGQQLEEDGAEIEEVVEGLTSTENGASSGSASTILEEIEGAAPSSSESAEVAQQERKDEESSELGQPALDDGADGAPGDQADSGPEPTVEMEAVESASGRDHLKSALRGMSEPAAEVEAGLKGSAQAEQGGEIDQDSESRTEKTIEGQNEDQGDPSEAPEADASEPEAPKKKRSRKRSSGKSTKSKSSKKSDPKGEKS